MAVRANLPTWLGGKITNLSITDRDFIRQILPSPAQQALFTRMPPNDQRHALAVANTLREAGHTSPALLQAALLHDMAKCLGQPIVHRVLIVILEMSQPALLQWLSRFNDDRDLGQIGGWRRPFVIHAEHPAIGADWATEAKCDALAISLIAKHQDKLVTKPTSEEDELLAVLQWADNLN